MRVAIMLLTLALLGSGATIAAAGVALEIVVPEYSFVAVTLDLAAGSPASGRFHLQHCAQPPRSVGSHGVFTVRDGAVIDAAIRPTMGTFSLDGRNVEVGVEGTSWSSGIEEPELEPYVITTSSCQTGHGAWSPRIQGGAAAQRLTFVGWSSDLPGVAYLNLSSSEGVEITHWTGAAQIFRPQQFEHGASVAVSPPLFVEGVAGGALLSQRLEPDHDFLGYWLPWRGEAQGHWWCDMNETNGCPMPWNEQYMTLSSKGATTWDVGYDYYAQVDASQHDVLVGIDLGRDDVLAQP